jgi:hypothetical protein
MLEMLLLVLSIMKKGNYKVWSINNAKRNDRSSEDIEHSPQELKQRFLNVLFEWVNASGHSHFPSLYEMINSCHLTL